MVNLPAEDVVPSGVLLFNNKEPGTVLIGVEEYFNHICRYREDVTQAQLELIAELWAIRLKALTQLIPVSYEDLRNTAMDFWRARFNMEFKMVCSEACQESCDLHQGDGGVMTPER